MVDVGGETSLAFDAFLKLVHHVIEGGGECRQVGEVGALQTSVQVPSRNRKRGAGGLAQRS